MSSLDCRDSLAHATFNEGVLGDYPLSSLGLGAQHVVSVAGRQVLLCRAMDGAVWAVENLCPHAFLPLAGGEVRGSAITCPHHGACFDLQTGRPRNALTQKMLKVFWVRIEGERVVFGLRSR